MTNKYLVSSDISNTDKILQEVLVSERPPIMWIQSGIALYTKQ